jgi:hypothetical protein
VIKLLPADFHPYKFRSCSYISFQYCAVPRINHMGGSDNVKTEPPLSGGKMGYACLSP